MQKTRWFFLAASWAKRVMALLIGAAAGERVRQRVLDYFLCRHFETKHKKDLEGKIQEYVIVGDCKKTTIHFFN